jgi:hypothetical protein
VTSKDSEPFWNLGGDVDEVRVTISVTGDELDPDAITKCLGVEPTFALRKGERRMSGSREIVQRTGVWNLDAPESSEWVLSDAIILLLDRLPPPGDVWDQLARKHHLRVFCGLFMGSWHQGCSLPPKLLGELAARHLELDLALYGEATDDEPSNEEL